MQNIKKVIEEEFAFLLTQKHSIRVLERNSELNVCYSKGNYEIVIMHDLGVYDIARMKSRYYVYVMIHNQDYSFDKDLLDCDELFGKEKIDKLNSDISSKTIIEQIGIYAEFIESNIETLNQIGN